MRQDKKLWHFFTCDSICEGSSDTFRAPRIEPAADMDTGGALEMAGRTAAVLVMIRGVPADATVVLPSLAAAGTVDALCAA